MLLLVALVVLTLSSAVHGAMGFGMDELGLSLVLLPGVLLGYLGSNVLRPFADGGHTHTAVLVLSGLAALGAIVEGPLAIGSLSGQRRGMSPGGLSIAEAGTSR